MNTRGRQALAQKLGNELSEMYVSEVNEWLEKGYGLIEVGNTVLGTRSSGFTSIWHNAASPAVRGAIVEIVLGAAMTGYNLNVEIVGGTVDMTVNGVQTEIKSSTSIDGIRRPVNAKGLQLGLRSAQLEKADLIVAMLIEADRAGLPGNVQTTFITAPTDLVRELIWDHCSEQVDNDTVIVPCTGPVMQYLRPHVHTNARAFMNSLRELVG